MYFETSLKEKVLKFIRLVSKSYAYPPRDITIEVSTVCGQKCAMCFRSPLGVSERTMSLELFTGVLSGIKLAFAGKQPGYLNFVGLGEPFCNGALKEILRLTKKTFPDTALNLATSLSVFDRTLMADLAAEKIINRMSVSIDSLDAGGPLHSFTGEIRKNLGLLKEMKASGGFKIRVQTLISSKERVEEVIKFAAGAGADEIQLMRIDLHAFKGEPPVGRPSLREERSIVRSAARLAGQSGLRCVNNNSYNIFMDLASAWDRYCLTTDDHIFIDVDGNVLPCFYLRDISFGNLARQPLAEISEKKRSLSFYNKQKRLCAGCDIYKRKHSGGSGA
ncbi:MAG: radical SAM protein [Elusimicrobia bacterium]|nr:radical SAM protein [Elusimicrobiota bacterium]